MNLALAEPWFDESEAARVAAQLSGVTDPFASRVEKRLEELLGRRVLLTTSCTHALELALLALGVAGREVICPSFTFASTANAILRAGGRPVFADIEEETLGLDPDDAARRVTDRTTAILPVHYAGVPARMGPLTDLCAARGLKLVEDAAHGLGGSWKGRPLGTLGDAGCFSFHHTKNVTCGEGGALVLRDQEVVRRAEIIREKGTNRSAFLRGDVDRYTWVAEGSSYVIADALAAILDAQLDKFPEIQERRARVAGWYAAGLGSWAERAGVRLKAAPREGRDAHHIFFLVYPDETARDRALATLRARGVGAAFHYVPLHRSPLGRSLGPAPSLPVTDRISSGLLRLPLHPRLSRADVDRVVAAVKETA